jgi:hypothetical protein
MKLTMPTPSPIYSVFRTAAGLLIVLVMGAWQLVSAQAAMGVLMSGLVLMGSFAMGGWTVKRVSQAAEAGMTGGGIALALVKVPALLLAIWMLLDRFDPISVVTGGSVVMFAVVLVASAEARRSVPKEVS